MRAAASNRLESLGVNDRHWPSNLKASLSRAPKAARWSRLAQSDSARIGQNPRAAESAVFVSHSWASLPQGHTGPDRGYTDTRRGHMGGSLGRWTLSREIAISRRSWCRISAWRQSPVPKPQAISQRQSPRRKILSSASADLSAGVFHQAFIARRLPKADHTWV